MSKLRNLAAPVAAFALGIVLSSPAQAIYLQAEESAGTSLGDVLAAFFGRFVSFFAANNGGVVP